MARGLVRREPHFVVMNETFRQFVLSSLQRTEVALLEEDSATSAWDAIRWPFFAALAASLAFLLVSQHDLRRAYVSSMFNTTGYVSSLFQTTLGVITAVAAALSTVVSIAKLFGEKRAAD
jgi:hypothetical protein